MYKFVVTRCGSERHRGREGHGRQSEEGEGGGGRELDRSSEMMERYSGVFQLPYRLRV